MSINAFFNMSALRNKNSPSTLQRYKKIEYVNNF